MTTAEYYPQHTKDQWSKKADTNDGNVYMTNFMTASFALSMQNYIGYEKRNMKKNPLFA